MNVVWLIAFRVVFFYHLFRFALQRNEKKAIKKQIFFCFFEPIFCIFLNHFFPLSAAQCRYFLLNVFLSVRMCLVVVVEHIIALSHENDENCIWQWHFPWKNWMSFQSYWLNECIYLLPNHFEEENERNVFVINIITAATTKATSKKSVRHLYANW